MAKSKNSSKTLESDRLNSLSWSQSVASDDPFFLFPNGGEGGMISLEEIDESEYGIVGEGFDFEQGGKVEPLRSKAKKRKRGVGDGSVDDVGSAVIDAKEGGGEVATLSSKEKKKKKIKRKRKIKEQVDKNGESNALNSASNKNEDADKRNDNHEESLLLNENDIHAWNELRLHPLLLKSIRRLGFKEPTPIQKACIPAASHQGKDVIGAAETGSGKTLAFGLPILQRLLEERDKESISPKDVKGGPLRALVVTPTRELALQVSDHLKKAAKSLFIQVVPIVGGMSSEKQERLLRRKPEIIVGTPGRLWQLMSDGNEHLVELHSLSFFVLDEADRMIENGHFHELQSIIDKLPTAISFSEQNSQLCDTVPSLQRKKRQTFVFSATIALSENFRRKLKRGSSSSKQSSANGLSSIETLAERAGMRPDAAIVDLTSTAIMADKLEESFIECGDEDKDAYLYYVLSLHGQGRTIIFCTSIDALRRISNILRILGISALTLHSQMQQRARLKAIDRFRGNENGVLVATDIAARGLDIPGVRTVVHYQLPHSAEVYIHRSGRTARASSDGCSIALISSSDKTKFFSLCQSLSKESLRQFPVDDAYMSEVFKRLSIAGKIDKIMHQSSQANAKKNWFLRHAESLGLDAEDSGSEEDRVNESKQKKSVSLQLKKLQQELSDRLKQPLRPKTFSHRFLAGSGVSPLLQQQLEELSKSSVMTNSKEKRAGLVVIGQHCTEALQALRDSGKEVFVNGDKDREKRKLAVTLKRKKREEKISARDKLKRKKKGNKMD